MPEYKDPQSLEDFLRGAYDTVQDMLNARRTGTVMKFAPDGDTLIPDPEAEPMELPVRTVITSLKLEHEAASGLNILIVQYVDTYADGSEAKGLLRSSNWAEIHPERLLGAGLREMHLKQLASVENHTQGPRTKIPPEFFFKRVLTA